MTALRRHLTDRGVRRLLSLAVLVALVSGMLLAVVRADGYRAPALELHDAGIWVTQRGAFIGRVNTELELIDTKTPVEGADQDVLQSGANVVEVQDSSPAQLRPVNVRTGLVGAGVPLPSKAEARLGGSTGVVFVKGDSGKLWIAPAAKLASQKFDTPSTIAVKNLVDAAVGADGLVHVLVHGNGPAAVIRYRPNGGQLDRKAVDAKLKPSSISAVGATSVVLDVRAGLVAEPGRKAVSVSALGASLTLQSPGPQNPNVVVASDTELGEAPLAGGALRTIWKNGGGHATPPVRLGSCIWGAWSDRPAQVRACGGSVDGGPISGLGKGPATLVFRVNRNRVVLNELVSGVTLMVDSSDVKQISDWSQALTVTNDDNGGTDPNAKETKLSDLKAQQGGADAKNLPKSADNKPPVARDDTAVTRPRRPVVIPVLRNDSDANGDLLVVESVEAPPVDVASVAIIGGGSAVQFTPAVSQTQPVSFRYSINDGRGGSDSAKVTVTIKSKESNAPPSAVDDTATVAVGRSVTVNVLANDSDPDGDALALTKVTATAGTVQFRPEGDVLFNAPGSDPGPVTVTYVVADEFNATSTGKLVVTVLPKANVKPIAVDDHVLAFIRQEATVNVLANDSDPNGDELTVVRVENPPDISVQWSAQGKVRVLSERPGSYVVTYYVTDGPETVSAALRVDVSEGGQQRPPVAVRDDVVLFPGVATVAPVLDNDFDPDGDVLVVVRVEEGLQDKHLTVEVIDHGYLRLTAAAPLAEAVPFTYTISDGYHEVVGTVVVRTIAGGVNQPPVAVRDEISVRAGNVTAIPVLANDSDPDGDELSLVSVSDIPANDGTLFLQGKQLRYQAPATEKGAVQARYVIVDTAGNKADGDVVIHVLPLDPAHNSPPVAATLEARVVAGQDVTVAVPLIGIDPEGDAVTFLGTGDPPQLGTIVAKTANTMVYRAGVGSAGTDRFTYRLRDALGAEATGSVIIAVIAPPKANSKPVAVADRATVRAGESVRIDVLANDSDPDGDPIELVPTELGTPSRGAVKIDRSAVVYTAPGGGTDYETSFEYGIADSRGATAQAIVTVAVSADAIAKPPIARDDLAPPQVAGATVVVDVLSNDEDPDGSVDDLKLTVEQPGVTVADRKLRFTMADKAMSFSYTITDRQNLSAKALVQVPLADADRAPVTKVGRVETAFNTPVKVPVKDYANDPEGKPLTVTRIVGTPRNGSADLQGETVLFTPQSDFAGEGGFVYEVSDGKNTAEGSVIVTIKARDNRPPVFTTLSLDVAAGENRSVDLSKSVSDPDNDKVTFGSPSVDPKEGVTASLNGTTLTLSASASAKGVLAKVTFEVNDGKPNGKVTGEVDVKVLANSKPLPSAVKDTARTLQEQPLVIDVLANDVDPAGVGLRIDKVTAGTGGKPEIQGDKVQFTPDKGFFGQASFTYVIFDKTNEAERTATGSVEVAVIGRPAKPPAPTGVPKNKAVDLQWTAPTANGAAIDKYEVQTDTGASQKCTFGSATACTVDGLTNGTTYRFQVRAHNEAGNSEWSDASAAVVPNIRPDVPAAPTLAFGDGQITLSFTAPANEGTPITEYAIQASPAPSSGGQVTVPASSTSYVWKSLTNGTAYRFRISATNSAGTTDFGAYSASETPAGVPLSLPKPTVSKGNAQLTVGWSEPNTNGAPIQSYKIRVKHGSTVDREDPVSDPTLRSKVETVPNDGTDYVFAILAVNKAGASAYGPDSDPVHAGDVPAQVGAVQAADGDGSSQLSFGAPANNGDAITSYKYRITGGSEQALASNKVVTGLTNGSNYTFQVRACNVNGCGAYSASSNSVTPYGVPGTPSVSGSVNGYTLNWSWSTPSNNGNAIVRYDVFVDGGLVQQGLSTGFSRAFNCEETHTLAVQAVNARGAGAQASSAQRTANCPRVNLANNHVVGANHTGSCSNAVCTFLEVSVSNFPPGATFQIDCRAGTSPSDNWCTSAGAWNISTDGAGNGTAPHKYWYGYCNQDVWVFVNGVESAHVRWSCT